MDEAWPGRILSPPSPAPRPGPARILCPPSPAPRPGTSAGLGLRLQLELMLESPAGIKGVSLQVFLQFLNLIR